jgi:hypothetical protein
MNEQAPTTGFVARPEGEAGDDEAGGAVAGNADPSGVSREGLTEARRVLLLCEFNTATLYLTFAQFQAMTTDQQQELRQRVRQACLA